MPHNYPELLSDMLAKVSALLIRHGVDRAAIHDIAFGVVELLRCEWGGSTIYIPRGVSFESSDKALEVVRRWDGKNTRELARELGIGERRLRQLYERGRKLARAKA